MKRLLRWALLPVGILWLWFFYRHPFEAISGMAAVLFLITAWHLIFGEARRSPIEQRKDRSKRHSLWR
ncbi:MAG TPA: hypothetical protein VNY05_27860 [Candidatus Acidoferrales bacterium]|nr:hypothetical protein [Candidatus Acidoferrales bacterium]